MLDKIWSFLKTVQMSAAEWIIITVATVIAGLVTALKIQGSRLHRAQVKLLEVQLDSKQARAAQDTDAARQVYRDALAQFRKAGGKIGLLLCLFISPPARSVELRSDGPNGPSLLPKCESALSACDRLVKTQDIQIQQLQDSIKLWKKQAQDGSQSLSPVWLGVGAGAMAGIATGGILGANKAGMVVGVAVGGIVGLGVGFLLR